MQVTTVKNVTEIHKLSLKKNNGGFANMMFINKLICLILTGLFFSLSCFAEVTPIKAENNAYRHNNKGLLYLEDKYYYGAIKEFQIAIDLCPDKQASAVFYVNLGKTYEAIGYNNLARPCFEKAVSLDPLCFEYYVKMAENYKKLGIVNEQLELYKSKVNSPLNNIVIGLLYVQKGHVTTGITVLDDFCDKEPNLIITAGVKNYIKHLTEL